SPPSRYSTWRSRMANQRVSPSTPLNWTQPNRRSSRSCEGRTREHRGRCRELPVRRRHQGCRLLHKETVPMNETAEQVIDRALAEINGRSLIPASEVTNWLLDIRLAVSPPPTDEEIA